MYPWTDGEGEEGWFEGIDLSFDTWKYDEKMPFHDAELVGGSSSTGWRGQVDLTAEQQRIVRPIFDRLWRTYADEEGGPTPEATAPAESDQLTLDATDVDLTDQGITAIPEQVFNLPNLRRLTLDGLSKLPDRIGELTTLEELDLSKTALTELPATIGQLAQLRILRLYGPFLHSLPQQLGDLVSLRTLQLTHLSIPLPDSIEGLIVDRPRPVRPQLRSAG